MASGKNLHLEHLEDEIINKGSAGGREVIKVLQDMGNFLTGFPGPNVNVTTKWDGAPAVVCGTDPSDGKFFVGTKSVFAKTQPKVCKSEGDVDGFYSGELASKLKAALKYLKDCQIKGVLQGDLMFTDDKKTETINRERLVTFKPNTITYAAPVDSKLGKQIQQAKLGIVFHTKYTGSTLPEMKSSFNIKDSDFQETSQTWIQKAEFRDIGNAASFSAGEKEKYMAAVKMAEGSLKQASRTLDMIQSGKKTLQLDTEFKKFFNNYVKAGRAVPSVDRAYNDFMIHLAKEYDKAIKKVKTLKSQAAKAGAFMDALDFFEKNKRGLKMTIAAYMNIQVAKMMLVGKMKQVSQLKLFVKRGDEWKVTTPEGFVAITGRSAVKLVDRLEFSNLNFQSGRPGG